jgi:hypothetical protein
MEFKLPFGLKDNKLVDVSQVDKGLECGCVCPACGHQLIARKGNIKVHHFAHHKSSECAGALETALHLAAKEILDKYKRIRIPEVSAQIGVGYGDPVQLYNEQTLQFDKVLLEKRYDDLIADLTVEINGKPFFIEIAVTHFIDEAKKKKVEKRNISTLEIDLSKLDRQITLSELEEILIDGLESKRWIYNTKQIAFHNEIEKLGKKFGKEYKVNNTGIESYIYPCPLLVINNVGF